MATPRELGRGDPPVSARRSRWWSVVAWPTTRVGVVLTVLGWLGWLGTGLAAHAGRIGWPTATVLGVGGLVAASVHRAVTEDDDGDG